MGEEMIKELEYPCWNCNERATTLFRVTVEDSVEIEAWCSKCLKECGDTFYTKVHGKIKEEPMKQNDG